MANHDYVVSNDTHANVRADLNAALSAVVTFNSGSSAPSTTFANMIYANTSTTPNIYYVRNNGNSSWASLFTDTGLIRAANGAVGGPSIGWSSTTTHGLYYGSSTSWSAACAGVNAFTVTTTLMSVNAAAGDIDFSVGAITGGANSLFVQGSDGFVGIGTGSPAAVVHVVRDGTCTAIMSRASGDTANPQFFFRKARGTHASPAALSSGDSIGALVASAYHSSGTPGYVSSGQIRFRSDAAESGDTVPTAITFETMPSGGSVTERMRVTSAGYVGIGATPTLAQFEVASTFTNGAVHALRYSAADAYGPNISGYKSRGTLTSPSDVSAGDGLAFLQANGYLNSDWRASGSFGFVAEGVSGSVVRSRLQLVTVDTSGGVLVRGSDACYKTLSDGVATTIFTMACANNTCAGCVVDYFVEALDASNAVQAIVGSAYIAVVNTAGTVSVQVENVGTQANEVSSGTITATVAASTANPSVISINANTSLTSTLLRAIYSVRNLSNQTITIS